MVIKSIRRRRTDGLVELGEAPVTPSRPVPNDPGPQGRLVEFSESRAPAPRRASVRRTTLPAQVGSARALTAVRRDNPVRAPRRRHLAKRAKAKPKARRAPVVRRRRPTVRRVRPVRSVRTRTVRMRRVRSTGTARRKR
jgi:hypothetical protein